MKEKNLNIQTEGETNHSVAPAHEQGSVSEESGNEGQVDVDEYDNYCPWG
jgi:hypothetical protein